MVTESTFICPYVKCPLPHNKPCAVESCSFNLADVPISRIYKRCFLNYVKAMGFNPYKREEMEQIEFPSLSIAYREQITKILLDLKDDDDINIKKMFYMSLFSIMTQDATASLTKKYHSPAIYEQCCVCGQVTDSLWLPRSGILPSGYGYCSWNCWQALPPPLLTLIKNLEVDFLDMINNIFFPQGQKSRFMFTQHLTQWILGETSLI